MISDDTILDIEIFLIDFIDESIRKRNPLGIVAFEDINARCLFSEVEFRNSKKLDIITSSSLSFGIPIDCVWSIIFGWDNVKFKNDELEVLLKLYCKDNVLDKQDHNRFFEMGQRLRAHYLKKK